MKDSRAIHLLSVGCARNRRAVKAKNENSLSACASERAHAREEWRKGKRAVERGEKKLWSFFRKWTHLSRKCTVFFVGRAFVSWGARRVARGCGKMSHAGVEIGGALRLRRARGAHCVENRNFAA